MRTEELKGTRKDWTGGSRRTVVEEKRDSGCIDEMVGEEKGWWLYGLCGWGREEWWEEKG